MERGALGIVRLTSREYGEPVIPTTANVVQVVKDLNKNPMAQYDTGIQHQNMQMIGQSVIGDLRRFEKSNDIQHLIDDCLEPLEDVPLSIESASLLDELYYKQAIDGLSDPEPEDVSMLQAVVLLSQRFAISKLAERKIERLVDDYAQVAMARDPESVRRREALDVYLHVMGYESEITITPSLVSRARNQANTGVKITQTVLDSSAKTVKGAAQRAGEILHDGKKRAAVVALFATGITSASQLAAVATEQTYGNNGRVVVSMSSIQSGSNNSANVQVESTRPEVAFESSVVDISTPTAAPITVDVQVSFDGIDDSYTEQVVSLGSVDAPVQNTVDVTVDTTGVEDIPQESEVVSLDVKAQEAPHELVEVQVANPTPEQIKSAAPETPVATEQPDTDVNLKDGETVPQLIDRLIASGDISSAKYAILQNYGTKEIADPDPINQALQTKLEQQREALESGLITATHADPAYKAKALKALAFFDAAVQDPTILDQQEIIDFINSLPDQGEDYHNRLFSQQLTAAQDALVTDEFGKLEGYDDDAKVALAAMYAYVNLAMVSDADQAAQIDAIKTEETRIAEEERQRKLQEQQSATDIEAITASPEQLTLSAIDRALAQGTITERYAVVLRVVIQREGAGALIAASGMTGNCMAEANGCDPTIEEYVNGIGLGIFQWSFSRRDDIEAEAARQGVPVTNLNFQINYAIDESKRRTERDGDGNEWAGLMASTDPAAAAEFWRWNFERPREHMNSTNTRIRVAQEVYNAVTSQMQAIQGEAAAAKQTREEAARIAEATNQDGRAMVEALKEEYGRKNSGNLEVGEDLELLALLDRYGNNIMLNPVAAKSFIQLSAAFEARFGHSLILTDHYRDYATQVRLREQKPDLAAVPGTSNHGWGFAIDAADNIQNDNSKEHMWMEENGPKFGWINPNWAQDDNPDNGAKEPWHWEWTGTAGQY